MDTDVLSHLQKRDHDGAAIADHPRASADPDFRITTVNAYEMLRGAFDLLHELRKKQKDLTPGFQLVQELFDYLVAWRGLILPYDDAADRAYRGLAARIRQEPGNDARIAAIALANGAAVWTCNVRLHADTWAHSLWGQDRETGLLTDRDEARKRRTRCGFLDPSQTAQSQTDRLDLEWMEIELDGIAVGLDFATGVFQQVGLARRENVRRQLDRHARGGPA